MTFEQLGQFIAENNTPDISHQFELKAFIDKYPYFQAGISIYLKCLYIGEDIMFRQELQRLSIFVNDRRALFYYILENEYSRFFQQKGNKKEIDKNRTDILLNAFFETLDDNAIDAQINALVNQTNSPVTDYFAYLNTLQKEEEGDNLLPSEPMKYQHIIDRFIDNADQYSLIRLESSAEEGFPQRETIPDEIAPDELQDDLFFTETLASIYIKQRKYERAYEIIKRLSLNYPEKNIYFANQISFLEKLIINSNVKNKRGS